jgi:hypothetical protein
MKALKQVLFVKDASKAADLWLPKMDQKLLEGSQQLRNTRAGLRQQATNVDLGPRWRGGDGT